MIAQKPFQNCRRIAIMTHALYCCCSAWVDCYVVTGQYVLTLVLELWLLGSNWKWKIFLINNSTRQLMAIDIESCEYFSINANCKTSEQKKIQFEFAIKTAACNHLLFKFWIFHPLEHNDWWFFRSLTHRSEFITNYHWH